MQSPIEPESPPTGAVRSVVEWLRRPLVVLPDVHNRRVRLLAWLLISLIVLVAFALVLVAIVDSGNPSRRTAYVALLLGLGGTFTLAYILNASGRYSAAAWLTVIAAMMQPWGSLALDPAILHGDFMPLAYATTSVLLASFLLSPPVTLLVAGAECAGLIVILLLNPSKASFDWAGLISFVVITSALGILASWIIETDLGEIDIQSRKLADSESSLRELSIRDHLTGLFNRRYLEESLDQEIIRSTRSEGPIGVIVFDVDGLKEINDERGHATGDTVLKLLAQAAVGITRASDLACRCGGDEFVLVLPETSSHVTLRRAEQLRQSVKDLQPDDDSQRTTISLGVAMFPRDGSTRGALLDAADAALYRAKRAGRDRAVIAQ